MESAKITVHPDPMSAELARIILLDRGLHPLPIFEQIPIPGVVHSYYVRVPDDERERAILAIKGTVYEPCLW